MALPSPSMRVRGDTAELARVRRRVAAWADAAGLGGRHARRLQMAVDEAVANAIEHGMDPDARVMLHGSPGRKRLTITIRYRGGRFDPTTATTPSADEVVRAHAEHGYGLHLIRRLADEVTYRWDRGTNEVALTVRG